MYNVNLNPHILQMFHEVQNLVDLVMLTGAFLNSNSTICLTAVIIFSKIENVSFVHLPS